MGEFDPADRGQVASQLALLVPATEEAVLELVEQLAADDFPTRQRARVKLASVASTMAPLLEKLRDEAEDPEVKQGLTAALANPPSRAGLERALAAAVFEHDHRGLGAELVGAISTAAEPSAARALLVAARTSALADDDRNALEKLLGSDIARVREAAVSVLAALGGDESFAKVKPALADVDDGVRLAAAEWFAARGDAACLDVLSRLAAGEDFYCRWRAAGMLRVLTDGAVDIDPMEPVVEAERVEWELPLAAWSASERPSPISLFDGGDGGDALAGWVFAERNLVDLVSAATREGFVRMPGTGNSAWGAPWRFQNYRLRLEWRFPWIDNNANAGLALCKFAGPLPVRFNRWVDEGLEVEIKPASTGELFPSGHPILVDGEPVRGTARPHLPDNERRADWNALEVKERDGRIRVWVNGLLQNEANGLGNELTSIGLRSDRNPIDFRRLTIEPLPGAKVAPHPLAEPEIQEEPEPEVE